MTRPPEPGTTLAGVLAHQAAIRPDRLAVSSPQGSRTYAELVDDVARISSVLAAAGVRRGDRVAIVARNGLAYMQLLYAASWSGVALVCVNWRLAPEEAQTILTDSAPQLVFAEREWADLVREVAPVIWVDSHDDDADLPTWYATGEPGTPPDQGQDDNSVALLLYTTGTTGEPKGVQLVERNLRAMSEQATPKWRMHPDMRFLAALPMFHVSGMSSIVTCVFMGGQVVIPTGTSVPEICAAIEDQGVTHTVLVPTVLTSLIAEGAGQRYDLSSLEVVVYGSAPSGSSLIEDMMAMLPATGFSQGYGLTETCAGVAIAPIVRHGDANPRPTSVGTINENCEARIVDPVSGRDVPRGGDGEIWLRTPQTTIGYWNKPAQTAAAISPDGWLRTGDIGCLDEDGYLFIRDRLKDLIISGGENIYSVEVENAIMAHPLVREAAVFGVPHPRWGETVRAAVVLHRGAELDGDGLQDFLDGRLARYKRPRSIQFVTELPKTGSGKILKRALRDEVSVEHA